MGGWAGEWMAECLDSGRKHGWVDDGWMDEWMGGWVDDGWMGG